jgi:hypothetical protein
LTTVSHSFGTTVVAVGGNVLVIEGGTYTVLGIVMCVMTVDGKLGNSVTGTKTTVLGTQTVGKFDGVDTITLDGIATDDGTYVRWIGTNVDGKAGGGITVAIVLGINTVVGIVMCVMTVEGKLGNSVTGTKTTVLGIHVE